MKENRRKLDFGPSFFQTKHLPFIVKNYDQFHWISPFWLALFHPNLRGADIRDVFSMFALSRYPVSDLVQAAEEKKLPNTWQSWLLWRRGKVIEGVGSSLEKWFRIEFSMSRGPWISRTVWKGRWYTWGYESWHIQDLFKVDLACIWVIHGCRWVMSFHCHCCFQCRWNQVPQWKKQNEVWNWQLQFYAIMFGWTSRISHVDWFLPGVRFRQVQALPQGCHDFSNLSS